MKRFSFILFIVISLFLSNCSNKDETQPTKNSKSEHPKNDVEKKKYWVNSSSGVIHNRTCRWYGNTKNGYYTDECKGRSCKICGGCGDD
jgi:LAS superfamily LD-carboxypeptidase LdcB